MPNGVGMERLPANNLPSGFVWQAMQSPARARYCPLPIMLSHQGASAAACDMGARRPGRDVV